MKSICLVLMVRSAAEVRHDIAMTYVIAARLEP
jgi:hypothetical protein